MADDEGSQHMMRTSFSSDSAASYSERHLIPALLELQPSGVTLTLEQSSGETCAEESMQSSVWVAAVVLCELMQRPCAAFPTGVGHWRGKRVLELGAGCGAPLPSPPTRRRLRPLLPRRRPPPPAPPLPLQGRAASSRRGAAPRACS